MTVLKAEVRTTYTIELEMMEWAKAVGIDELYTRSHILEMFREFPIRCNREQMDCLTKNLGFDGWSNVGYITNGFKLRCTMYMNGANFDKAH